MRPLPLLLPFLTKALSLTVVGYITLLVNLWIIILLSSNILYTIDIGIHTAQYMFAQYYTNYNPILLISTPNLTGALSPTPLMCTKCISPKYNHVTLKGNDQSNKN